MLVGQWVGARLGQQVLRGAADAVLTGVRGAHAAGCAHALHLAAEGALTGAHPLTHRASGHNRVLFTAAGERERDWRSREMKEVVEVVAVGGW